MKSVPCHNFFHMEFNYTLCTAQPVFQPGEKTDVNTIFLSKAMKF